ncbi:carbohydrate ABC transporter permease [Paenibacillus hamazuiensis]|uniref:carbohydrate ABC transporter permease n=1 Tax=Paenibacillus hamazuiensis TaxID=2936508 RepID=UPI0020105456|nr:sugar ABC transporter permease [Paenibacillus hamazuiensis]
MQRTTWNRSTNTAIDFFRKVSFVLPAMVMLVLLTGYPLFQVIQMSFYDYSVKSRPVFSGTANYSAFLHDPLFWNALKNTLIFTFASVAGGLIAGLTLALLLNQSINSKVRGVFRSILMFPWLFSSTVVAAAWMLILNPFGLLNWMLKSVGLEQLGQTAWLSHEQLAIVGVIFANVWRGFPFMMLMLLAGLQTISKDLYEASDIDGAGFFQRLFYVTLPQLRNILLTLTILEIIWNFRSFDLIFLMTGGGPMNATEVLSTYVYQFAFRTLNFGYASATAIFMLLVMVLASAFYLKASLGKESN